MTELTAQEKKDRYLALGAELDALWTAVTDRELALKEHPKYVEARDAAYQGRRAYNEHFEDEGYMAAMDAWLSFYANRMPIAGTATVWEMEHRCSDGTILYAVDHPSIARLRDLSQDSHAAQIAEDTTWNDLCAADEALVAARARIAEISPLYDALCEECDLSEDESALEAEAAFEAEKKLAEENMAAWPRRR